MSKTEYVDWWDSFIDKLTKEKYKEKAQWYLKLLPRQQKEKDTEPIDDISPPQIRRLLIFMSKTEYVDWWDSFIDKLTKEKYKEKAQ